MKSRIGLLVLFSSIVLSTTVFGEGVYQQGLVGAWYQGDDLTRIGTSIKQADLDVVVDALSGHGNDWSAQWVGYVTAPTSGEVIFGGECNKELIVEVSDKTLIHLGEGKSKSRGSVEMVKGRKYPIHVKYLQHTGGEAYFKVLWSWAGQDKQVVDPTALSFSAEQAEWWNYVEKPDPAKFDFGTLSTVPVENYFAFREPGRFGGWPANNGVWIWGSEILVGFELGYHDANPSGGHAIRSDKPRHTALSRSLDGGRTWKVEDPDNFVDDEVDDGDKYKDCPGVNFAHPDFAMRMGGRRFFVSYDRGKTWEGAYRVNLKGVRIGDLTSRTDYIVLGPNECLVFMSGETGIVESNYQDRSFCAKTTDGGKTFQFQGWMTHNTEVRSVMSSTVYVGDKHLVSVMRRKHEHKFEDRPSIIKNWIETAESKDDGKTWRNLGKAADTDLGDRNGNPPAMVKLSDGRLCLAYGYRDFPYGIRIKLSSDNGRTWGDEISLRHDGGTWDLGYPRMVVRPDGKVVVMYYYNTKDIPAQHIGVTIWDPAGDVYLFSNFTSEGDGLKFCYSKDLYNWTDIPGLHLRPLIGANIMRDPFINQGPDGTFHIVWTTGWRRKDIGYCSTKDLVHWEQEKLIPVMEGKSAANCWAPKIFYDDNKAQWMIIWSTWLKDGSFGEPELPETSKQHRIFYTTTKDFENFTETKLLFDPGYSCIDAYILKDSDSRYLMFYKDERGNDAENSSNPNWQNIRMATADNPYGPYTNITERITGNGPGKWHNEGACAVKKGSEYLVYYDHHSGEKYYGAVKSTDLKNWTDISGQLNFPAGTKHGSIIKIKTSYLDKLLEARSAKK